MKKLPIISLLILSFSSYAQLKIIDLKSENLKGKVKSYIKKTQVNDKTTKQLVLKYHEKYTFNKNGNISSIETFGDDNQLDSKELYNYEKGKLVQITQYNANGKAGKTTLFNYNVKNQIISKQKFNNRGKLQYETSYIYNTKGQLTTQQKLIPSINYSMKENYKYDEKGNMIERSKKARIGSTKEVFEYNTQKLAIKKTEFNALGELFSTIHYKYNKQGDKISLQKKDTDGNISYFETYQYQYDSEGNWVEKINFEMDKKVSIDKRRINYQ